MLAPEQIDLLSWLNKQIKPLSFWQMEQMKAPFYTRPRAEKMYKEGLLDRDFRVNSAGDTYGVYSISDKGKATLLEAQQIADKQTKEKAQQEESLELQRKQTHIAEKTYKATVVQIGISLVTFVCGLFFEHCTGIIGFFFGLVG